MRKILLALLVMLWAYPQLANSQESSSMPDEMRAQLMLLKRSGADVTEIEKLLESGDVDAINNNLDSQLNSLVAASNIYKVSSSMPDDVKKSLDALKSGNHNNLDVIRVAEYYIGEGNLDAANRVIDEKGYKDRTFTAPELAILKRQLGRAEEADAIISKILSTNPAPKDVSVEGQVEIAKYLKANNGDKAMYQKYVQNIAKNIRKTSGQDMIWLAEAYKEMGKPKDAEKVLKEMDKYQMNFDENLAIAEYYAKNNNVEKSNQYIQAANKSIRFDRVADVRNMIAFMESQGGDAPVAQAKAYYETLSKDDVNGKGYRASYDWLNTYLTQKGQTQFLAEQQQIAQKLAEEKYLARLDKRMGDVMYGYRLDAVYKEVDFPELVNDYLNYKKSPAYNEAQFSNNSATRGHYRDLPKELGNLVVERASYQPADVIYQYKDALGESTALKVLGKDSKRALNYLIDNKKKEALEWYYNCLLEKYPNGEYDYQPLFDKAEAVINGGGTEIEQGDFRYRKSGKYYTVEYIGKGTSVTFPTSVTHNGQTYAVKTVIGAPGNETLTTVIIPDGIEKVKGGAFKGCTKLTTVQLPTDLKIKLPEHAFAECPQLTTVKNYPFRADEHKYNSFYSERGPEIYDFLGAFYKSPKTIDIFYHEMMKACKPEYLESRAIPSLCVYGKGTNNYRIGKYLVTDILAKRALVDLAAKGKASAMVEICNLFLSNNCEAITAADYLKYAKLLVTKKPAFGYYFMGRAYEDGIGVTPSRTTARQYYGKGRQLNDSDCERGWWRMM